jgi:HAD superfamily hydrolase (TIGR01509 family)
MPRIKAVIFDMDGVLIDAKEWHYEAMNRALALFGQTITREQHVTEFDGLPTRKKLELLSAKTGFPTRLHPAVSKLKQQFTMELIESECSPRFEHVHALSQLKRAGYTLGVASNSIRVTVKRMMELAGLARYLDFQLSNEDVAHPKPHPEIYVRAARMAGTSPDQCAVVEDNHHGIEAATRAGAHVLAVSGVHEVHHQRIDAFLASLNAQAEANAALLRAA